ncbi:hybrid sensor histidine kinase/response regulator [Oceanidesulfovibrio indonesiensis]|uniref:Sensory/regulatory protein RpfC n=1 Tax=Oceanidesulfovibrio indonesiensis TaxID=54767 RepID=A0A7M3MIU5_9BACT|nr:PAS domain S-box protein [Oceanidesulfovibrio indonesiensis]TVM19320.1 hybrid sensor histidine kinase/response regulator [Oceanidesulfovibrio indonesiensis]
MTIHTYRRNAFKVALFYAVAGSCWIIFSDLFANLLSDVPQAIAWYQMLKGLLFVLFSALLIYMLAARQMSDIVEAHKREEESEKRYRTIVENVTDALIIFADRDTVAYANPMACEMLQLPLEKVLQARPKDIFGSSFYSIYQDAWDMAQHGEALFGETSGRVGSGRTIHFEYRATPMRHDGQLHLLASFRDITERKRSAEALARSESKFRHVLENIPLIGISLDTKCQLTFANDYFLELTGYTRKEALGSDWIETFIPEDIRDTVRNVFETTMARQELGELSTFENEILTRSGSRLNVAWSNVLSRDSKDRIVEVTCMGVDLTERSRAEEALRTAKDAAEIANQVKNEFLATMSHEVRTPLNGVMGMLQLMESTALDEEQRQYIATAMISSQNLLRILSDILDISRIEANKFELADEEFELTDVVAPVVDTYSKEATIRGLDFRYEIDTHVPKILQGDPGRLRQVLFNLVGNAVKYTESGEVVLHISVPFATDSARVPVHFMISDTGIGIPDQKLAEVFDSFTQADSSYTRRFGGVGLGLTIVRRLVQMMDGSLVMDSEPGRGTDVHVNVFLKRVEDERTAPAHQPSQPQELSERPLKLLVVEDETVNRFYAVRLLQKLGHDAREAMDGEEALQLLATEHFDAVFMDIHMPKLDGVSATRSIRENTTGGFPTDIPIIAMTAYAMPGDEEEFKQAGMDDYLAKPVEAEELAAALERISERLAATAA